MQAQSLVCGNIIAETRAHYIAIKFREKMLVWFSIAPLQQEPSVGLSCSGLGGDQLGGRGVSVSAHGWAWWVPQIIGPCIGAAIALHATIMGQQLQGVSVS